MWRTEDLQPFSELNADPRVMRYFPAPLTRAESDRFVAAAQDRLSERGFGWWAIETRATAEFIGFAGLSVPTFEAHFTPCVETGWRLAFDHWRQGFATEAARAALAHAHAFGALGLDEVVAFTAAGNERSRKVMERLGMNRSVGDDFDHPRIPEGHILRRHVLYRLPRVAPVQSRG